jgi:hypothetical protein
MLKRIAFVVCFLAGACASTSSSLPEMRMTPAEVRSGGSSESQIGSSKLAGVHTKVLSGDPAKAGFYSIPLFVPAHTTIQADSHRDDRMATVVSGEWQFGYGKHFDENSLKALTPGECLFGTGRCQPFCPHWRGSRHRSYLRLWSRRTPAISTRTTSPAEKK